MKPGRLLMATALAAVGIVRREQISRPALVAVGVAVVGLLVTGSGLVQFPSVEEMVRQSTTVLGDLTYGVAGAFAFAESGAFVGLIAPGELIVIIGGVTAGRGTISLSTLIAVVWACALAGDLVSYALGRRLGRELLGRHGAGFGITEARLDRVERFLDHQGAKTILVGRFIGVVRALAPFMAGASGMPTRRFVPVAALASGLWAATFSCLGYAFWESLDTLIALVERGSVVLAAVAAFALFLMRLRRRPPPSADLEGSG